jgi:predicted outer membrane repeat protein
LVTPLRSALAANIFYVAPNGTGSASGADWTNATTLQTALASAVAGDQIWVKQGTYTPGTVRTATFALKSGVAIYGGFAGDESALSQRNSAINITTLSGDIGTFGDSTDNAYHVVTGSGVNQDTLLDGFSIVGGNANTYGPDNTHIGGGIYLLNAGPTIRNAILRDNSAQYGGAIGIKSGAPILSNLLLTDNQAAYGGGMTISGSNAIVGFVVFRHNRGDYGGAIYIESPSSPQISQTSFSGNTAVWYGGAIATAYSSSPSIRQATFAGNTASAGGAIASNSSNPVIHNSILWGNLSDSIYAISSVPEVQYSIIEGNYTGVGNLNLNPLFVNAAGADGVTGTADDDLHVQAGSPAIDAGNNADIPADLTDADGDGNISEAVGVDLDGQARVANGIVDMGIYEHTTTPTSTPTNTPTARLPIDYYIPLICRS